MRSDDKSQENKSFDNNVRRVTTSVKGLENSNSQPVIGLEEIKVELPVDSSHKAVSSNEIPMPKELHGSEGSGSGIDSCNDDEEIGDENRNSAAMQINMGNIFRAGVQKGNFGGIQRRLSPNNKFPGLPFNNTRNEGLPQILEIGTEETVLR